MNNNPKLKLNLTRTDRIIEFFGWILLLTIWIWVLISYKNLPDIIPTHYNASDVADGFGEKVNLLILPLLATVLFATLTLLNKFPHKFNYLVEITPENAYRQYVNATRMLRALKLVIVIVFGLVIFQTLQYKVIQKHHITQYFPPLTLMIIFVPIVYFIGKSFILEKKK
ncbi:conserved membrane hypothetical protein [Capnocytophaga canimorsus]|uniref:Uncharacterized protein n=1 Tax=Capnocytophaga canimorsus TaxID=28188 RepID=A0A0B7HTJ4_9FLAO|nr:DUF1648 domain-containing protein [Capnocytophaga canimorsus]ATA76914.1 DUF1648 domain-containing protein [Capnocytophaga canimorsus]PJI83955.1 uncharacterized protein DUF1648 [Capnocytophaga canimorsus]CEN41192.1 conserved membrane hypothetical protein [Capnocytophaga canimorsus]STA72119.1 Predicted integral membrane protein [Capnocytophaga canimorsus]